MCRLYTTKEFSIVLILDGSLENIAHVMIAYNEKLDSDIKKLWRQCDFEHLKYRSVQFD